MIFDLPTAVCNRGDRGQSLHCHDLEHLQTIRFFVVLQSAMKPTTEPFGEEIEQWIEAVIVDVVRSSKRGKRPVLPSKSTG